MDDALEMLLSFLLIPFGSKEEKIRSRMNKIQKKPVRIVAKAAILLLVFAVVAVFIGLITYLINGYWF